MRMLVRKPSSSEWREGLFIGVVSALEVWSVVYGPVFEMD